MLLKIVSLFLVFIAVLAMFGKLGTATRVLTGRKKAGKCPACGRHKIGKGGCPCKKG